MNVVLIVILQCIVGTSLMTAFSYALANLFNKQFREPMLLNKVFSKVAHKNLSHHHPLGWLLHYGVGLMFLIGYHLIFRSMGHTLLNYAVAGFVSGLAGAAIWMITFNLTGILNTAGRKFYYQLVPAHIVFGLGACITLTLLQM